MGLAAITIKFMPEDVETDLEAMQGEIKNLLPEFARLNTMEVQPIAFGLSAVVITVIIDDKKDSPDAVMDSLNKVTNTQSVEITDIGLIS